MAERRLTVTPGFLVYLDGQEARRFFGSWPVGSIKRQTTQKKMI
jgi:hypothetical protein